MLCVSFFILNAQTITWTGAGNGTNWYDPDNWDLEVTPTTIHDVILPSGSVSSLTDGGSSIQSLTLEGTAVFNMGSQLSFTAPSSIGENAVMN